jgi:hypothetical protein
MWDNTNLYIGARILDANLNSDSSDPWEDDAVEVYIDANNNKLTTYDGLDNQIIKNYNKSTVFTKLAIAGLQHGWAAVSGGYTIELAVPWSQLGIAAPAQGTTIGFDIGYDDDDNGGTRDGQAVWNGTINNYQNTSGFGSLVLNSGNSAREDVNTTADESGMVSYWPNEVTDRLHILTDGSFDRLVVIDAIGKQHLAESIVGKKEVTLDVTGLGSGVHFIKMQGWNRNHVFRIIKR